jgi:uncharacterized protein
MDAFTNPATLSLGFGLIVGVSLGVTGGGGSIFAVPLLIYGLGIPVRTAIGLSLAVVGLTAGFGAALRLKAHEIEFQAGLVFAAGGMLFAPMGTWIGQFISPAALMTIFALLMAFVGWRMWSGKAENSDAVGPCVAQGNGRLRSGCYTRLSLAGAAAGILSGIFGIGGGFVIVPALLYVTGTTIHRAVATSLMVIFLIALSGVGANIFLGQLFPMPVSAMFLSGGLIGMIAGAAIRKKLSGPSLRQTFAIAMWLVGAYIIFKNIS